ncbi:MAG: lytic transglycosylase domain-containing protein [Acetobacteraceae bacterium]|nr:lytic transglycosylase domain-containing protein [Acetobacteraceae bacterium]
MVAATVLALSLPGSRFRRLGLCLALLGAVAGCASHSGGRLAHGYGSGRLYRAPGPPGDPWGPYIREASLRFGVPDRWIRAVMRQESGGRQYAGGGGLVTSSAGAMGLMQVMPETYDMLRFRYDLGEDPYDPHNNILAGTAYIREMYDRYGSPGFLAAYNAGPNRLDRYLGGDTALPDETVSYVAAIAPGLGADVPLSGPLAVYADTGGGGVVAPEPAPPPLAASAFAAARSQTRDENGGSVIAMAPIVSPGDPGAPDPEPPPPIRTVAAPTPAPVPETRFAVAAPRGSGGFPGGWAIQVGAYADAVQARTAADAARSAFGVLTLPTQSTVGATMRPDGQVLYRARVTGLSASGADDACRRLRAFGRDCMVVPPAGTS